MNLLPFTRRRGLARALVALAVVAGTASASAQGEVTTSDPVPTPASVAPLSAVAGGPVALVVPDSEYVYGPTLYRFDANEFAREQGGYLARYVEIVGGEPLTGGQIVTRVAEDFSVGPRLLLALVEMHSGWVRDPEPAERNFPVPEPLPGLSAGLSAAADALNTSYYSWRRSGNRDVVLAGGASVTVAAPNAGTYGILAYLARGKGFDEWASMTAPSRFAFAWASLFGDPYESQVMPVLPETLPAVDVRLPFDPAEVWFFVAGPHSAWGSGGPPAAVDFAPPPAETTGCAPAPSVVRAAADGRVLQSRAAGVLVDLDDDGFVGSGWVHVYTHLSSIGRVAVGAQVDAGDPLGYASCDGGLPTVARVAFARRYNGEWIPVDNAQAPLVMDGWAALPGTSPGSGWLAHDGLAPLVAGATKDPRANAVLTPPGQLP